jgi:hypothetical protein
MTPEHSRRRTERPTGRLFRLFPLAMGLVCISCQERDGRGVTPETVGKQASALSSVPVFQDPSGDQVIAQQAGTGLFVNRLNNVRYADQFPGADLGAQINAAVADLGPSGGTIEIPAGSYSLATTINLDDTHSIVLQGQGAPTAGAAAATTLWYTASSGPVISARSTAGVYIKGMMLLYSSSSFNGAVIDFSHSATGGDSAFAIVEDCFIGGSGTSGAAALVSLDKTIDSTIRNNHFGKATTDILGMASAGSYSNANRILGNTFRETTGAPIQNAGEAWVIEGNTFEAAAGGTAAAYASDPAVGCANALTIAGNWMGDANQTGTWIRLCGDGLSIQGNLIGDGSVGIQFVGSGSIGVTITGNRLSSTTPIAGADATGNSHVVVLGNSQGDRIYSDFTFNGDVSSYGASISRIINVRNIVPKTMANGYCPTGSTAIYTPRSYIGKTGNDICAANVRTAKTCMAVNFVWVTTANGSGQYSVHNLTCASNVNVPWPWGSDNNVPDTMDGEWGYGSTWVVCCQ